MANPETTPEPWSTITVSRRLFEELKMYLAETVGDDTAKNLLRRLRESDGQ
jgi:hypothetical protein